MKRRMGEEDWAGGCWPQGSVTAKRAGVSGGVADELSGWEGFVDLPCLSPPFAEGLICLQTVAKVA